jgi:uncharacterized cupredoxin-like copper-binding protein
MRTLRTKGLAVTVVVALVGLAIAGCGGGKKNNSSSTTTTPTNTTTSTSTTTTPSSGAATKLKVSADPGGALIFDRTSLTAKAGKVTIDMTNPSSAGIQHSIAIEGNGVDKRGATANPGGQSVVTASLKPGKYEFYCPVDGHKAAGMTGTLTVQ